MAYLDLYTAEGLQKIVDSWYGEHNTKNWVMSEKLAIAVAKVIHDAGECTASFKLVPQATGPVGPLNALSSGAIGYAKELISDVIKHDQYSKFCLKQKAREARSMIEEVAY